MWHEQFAPKTLNDVTWSMIKLRELADWYPFTGDNARFIEKKAPRGKRGAAAAATPAPAPPPPQPQCAARPVMLMHGPSGCGKLSVLKIALQSALSHSATDVNNTALASIFFSVEHSYIELESFLNDVLRSGANRRRVFIVKELPATFDSGRPGSPVMDVLRRFIRTVDAVMQRGGIVPPVIFLHTSHDTHSQKVDLFRSFPTEFLDSSRTQQFHCTAATTLSLANRLRTVASLALGQDCVPVDLVTTVAEAAHGDVRQALLQLQWITLTLRPAAYRQISSEPRSRPQPGAHKSRGGPPAARAVSSTVINLLDDSNDSIIESSSTASDDDDADVGATDAATAVDMSMLQRDDYIDVAHGAARVLTQKYAVADVLNRLTVPPERLMAYMMANVHRYFNSDSFESLARATVCCSQFDVAAAVARDPACRIPSNPLTLAADEVAIRCFGAEYARLPGLAAPRDFTSLSPLPPVVPALQHLCRRAPINSGSNDDDDGGFTPARSRFVRRETNAWRATDTDTVASRLRAELNALHSTSSTRDTCFDVLPLLPRILLTNPAAVTTAASLHPTAVATAAPAVPAMPKRTLFIPGGGAKAATAPAAAPSARLQVSEAVIALARHQLGPYGQWKPQPSVLVVPTLVAEAPASGDVDDPIGSFDDD